MEESQLPPSVNPSNFPAKLWRLVNSPRFRSICWDARGEGLLIDQPLFERELLGAGPDRAVGPAGDGAAEAIDLFKTKNFTSFVRQLNLYGFRKLLPGPRDSGAARPLLHFHSPHFRRDRPELLVQLKRLTSANKKKLAAGLEVTNRPPNRFQRLFGSVLCGDRPLPPATAAGANGEWGNGVWGFGERWGLKIGTQREEGGLAWPGWCCSVHLVWGSSSSCRSICCQ
ncbi:heat shock factor protein 5 [Patagioenas fasciata monilis]|uniref:Heat shock factor protein 5 n=1 Tax=Patagioenas fasciata monilis TaxID=372326 RepID=A0A1V4K4J7_PATFA|nr:heat shock factor protein 5 [Patagioenas fasciata monilis]